MKITIPCKCRDNDNISKELSWEKISLDYAELSPPPGDLRLAKASKNDSASDRG